MATYLKSLGYRTMFAGKYLNQYGTPQSPSTVPATCWDSFWPHLSYTSIALACDPQGNYSNEKCGIGWLGVVQASPS